MAKTSLLLIKYPPQPQGSRSAATAGTSSSTSSSAQQNSSAAERQTTQQQQKTTKNSASGFFGSRYSRVCRNSPTRPPPPIPTPKPSQFNQSSCSSLINRRRNLLPNTLLGEEIDIDSSSPTAVEEEEEEKGAITVGFYFYSSLRSSLSLLFLLYILASNTYFSFIGIHLLECAYIVENSLFSLLLVKNSRSKKYF